MIRSTLFNVLFYAATAIILVGGSPLLFGPRQWAMAGLKFHARVSIWLLHWVAGIRLEVRGTHHIPQGAAIVASKHQSSWDTFGLIPLMPDPAMIMKAELMKIPFYGWFSRKFGMIAVERGKATVALRRMLAESQVRLASKRQVVIFPEGRRRPPGAPPDYRMGVVKLYEGCGVPCVPVASTPDCSGRGGNFAGFREPSSSSFWRRSSLGSSAQISANNCRRQLKRRRTS